MSPIDCERALREIELFLDGELDSGEREMLRAHLSDCPPCGDRAQFQRRLKGLLARTCWQEAPELLRLRIEQMLVEGPPEAGSS